MPLLYSSELETPLGQMFAMASEVGVCLLAFMDRENLTQEVQTIQSRLKGSIRIQKSDLIIALESELQHYFQQTIHTFKTPLHYVGSLFQEQVWKQLAHIPYGQTRSYADIALALGNPKAMRAVGNANASNPLPIVLPCHRVIQSNGSLGGYNGGVERKQWLLQHEGVHV